MTSTHQPSKAKIVVEIASLLDVECPPMSSGSTEPKTIFVLVNERLGLGLDSNLPKADLAREIVRASGAGWDPDFESRGATVTRNGLTAVLSAVRFWIGTGQDDLGTGSQLAPVDGQPRPVGSASDVARASFIEAVALELDPLLEVLRFRRSGSVNTRRGGVYYRLPAWLEIAEFVVARVVVAADFVHVGFHIDHYPDSRRNWQVAEILREAYSPLVGTYGLRVDTWHGSGAKVRRDRIITRLETGYLTGQPTGVAHEAAELFGRWKRMLTEHVIRNPANQVGKPKAGGA